MENIKKSFEKDNPIKKWQNKTQDVLSCENLAPHSCHIVGPQNSKLGITGQYEIFKGLCHTASIQSIGDPDRRTKPR